MGVLDGKVVLVTGAGRGIGRECALLAAREGAQVIVNDLGGGVEGGDEGSAGPAQEVVTEIREAGGEAAVNSDSVALASGARNMVEQALDTFKGLHAIISPAGILRDKMIHKMDQDDWDAVIDVHLNGSYNVVRASIEHFRDQQDGAYVLFTSTSGLIGNVGQANYAAAKLGIAGLSRVVAMEGAKKNVRSNVIAPFAWTRMIATIPIKDEATAARMEKVRNATRADQIAPPAIAMCAPGAENVSGQIFCVRGNEIFLMSQPRPVRGMGRADGWSAEDLVARAFPAMAPDFFGVEETSRVIFSSDPL